MRNENVSYILRIIIGVYLGYLAYQLIGGYISGESSGILFAAAGVLFALIGIACVFSSVRYFIGYTRVQESKVEKQFDQEEEQKKEEEE